MADRAQPVNWALAAGVAAAVLVLALTLGTLGIVVWRSAGIAALAPADWATVRFTVAQALISAALSVLLAVPVARALARRQFIGRGALITLLGAPFILPVIVAVLGLLAVFGRGGILNAALGALGLPQVQIYGPQGVVLAHVFFNLPLAVRLILHGWLSIPAERFRLAASLGFSARDVARRLEAPMLREVVPGVALVIFLICLTSFAVTLTLGGGPRATTVELAIYEAFRFDFDLGRAAQLAALQFGICTLAALLSLWVSVPAAIGGGLDRRVERWDAQALPLRVLDVLVLGAVAVFLALPLLMVIAGGIAAVPGLPASVWAAAGRSVLVALASAALSVLLGLSLALGALRWRLLEGVGMLALAASPLVIGTGLFIVLFPLTDPVALALPVTALVNAVLALPFVLRAVMPDLRAAEAVYGRLADGLGMTGAARLRWLILPRLRRALGFAGGVAAALSMGDLGVVALFGAPERATLPLQIYALMGVYRIDDAMGAALLLLALSLGLFRACDWWGARNAVA